MIKRKTTKIIFYALTAFIVWGAAGFCPMKTNASFYKTKPVSVLHNCSQTTSDSSMQRARPIFDNCCLKQNKTEPNNTILNQGDNIIRKNITSNWPNRETLEANNKKTSFYTSEFSPPPSLAFLDTIIKKE